MTPDEVQKRRAEQVEAEKAERDKRTVAATTNSKPTENRPGLAPHDRPLEEVDPESYKLKKEAALQMQAPEPAAEELKEELVGEAAEREAKDREIAQDAKTKVEENTAEKKVLGPTPEEADAQREEAAEAKQKKDEAQADTLPAV